MILKDESPEGERKLEGRLRVLSLEAGNGFWAWKAPGGAKSGAEGGSSRPNGLGAKFRIKAEGIGRER